MSWILEQPLMIVVLGAITATVLGFLWLQSQRKPLLQAFIAVLVLTVVGVIAERLIVTDREAVATLLDQVAREVARNDLAAVLSHVHSQASPMRAQAEAELPKYRFEAVSIKPNLEITFDRPNQPSEATAKFNVMVIGSHRDPTIEQWRVPRYVIVTFRKEGGEWRAYSYEHHEPQAGWRP